MNEKNIARASRLVFHAWYTPGAWRSFAVLVVALCASQSAAAEDQWADVYQGRTWPTAPAACIQGEVEARIAALRAASPSIQYRYRTIAVNEYLPDEESQCNYVIERRVGSIWVTQETGPRNHLNAGGDDPCPEGALDAFGFCRSKNAGPPMCPDNGSNPIDSGTANKYQFESDYAGAGAFPLVFARHYNSLTQEAGALGRNWRHHYQRTAVVTQLSGDNPSQVRFYRADGKRYVFNLVASVWQADADLSGYRLQRLASPGGWGLTTPADEVELYDPQGRLTSITLRSGQRHTLVYDTSNRLGSVTDTDGRQLVFAYASDRISAVTVPGAQTISFGYDAGNRLQTVSYPGATSRTYVYNEATLTGGANLPWALTGIIDESATRFASFTYDTQGRATRSEHAGGAGLITVAYQAAGVRTVTDSLNAARTFTYSTLLDASRNTAISQSCTTCGGAAQALQYDANANVSSRTDFNENETTYSYDLARNLETSRTQAAGSPVARTIGTTWHATYRVPAQIDEPGRRTVFTHDAAGNVLTRTVTDLTTVPNASRVWTYTYDAVGRVLTANGPRTDVNDATTYVYYNCTTGTQCGQVQTITNALNQVTTYNTYNAHGQPLTITDPNGAVTTLTYDLRQRLTSRSEAGETTTFTYYPTGLLQRVTLPDTSFIEYTYDAAHRLTQIEDAEGSRIVYTLDAMGNRTAEQVFDPTNALARTRSRVYNSLSRLTQEIGAAGTAAVTTTFGYDDNGNQTSISAPIGRNSTQSYDELNRLSSVTDPASGSTEYGYDALDQLISVTDPRNLTTNYQYNGLGDVKQLTSPDTGSTQYTYDETGNVHIKTDARGQTATHTYDALNRVAQIQYSDQTTSYTYDTCLNGKGRLCGMSDASGSTSYEYDPQGRVTRKSQTVNLAPGYGMQTREVRYTYANGRLTQLRMPSGVNVYYTYDVTGRISGMNMSWSDGGSQHVVLSDVLYDSFGDVRGWTWANGTLAVREYDQDGRLTTVDSAGQATLTYDDADRITAVATDGSAPSWNYGYDSLDRLTGATRTGLNRSYTYDANGNRLGQGGTQPSTYSYSSPFTSNRVSSVSGSFTRSYSYDAAGNVTGDGTTTYVYDGAARMKAAGSTEYFYNGLGQRVLKRYWPGNHYSYLYDEAGHVLEKCETWVNSNACTDWTTQQMLWLGDIPVATLLKTVYYNWEGYISYVAMDLFNVHSDHLNTPRRFTRSDASNALAWRWDSDPFGIGAANGNPAQDPNLADYYFDLRLPGQVFDVETGLHYNYFRDYDPATGRYVQSDPIGLEGGVNTYAYSENDPINGYDQFGDKKRRCTPREFLILRAAVIAACKGNTSCSPADPCWKLTAKIAIKRFCIQAQKELTRRCYPDRPSHDQRIEDEKRGIARCQEFMKEACKDCETDCAN